MNFQISVITTLLLLVFVLLISYEFQLRKQRDLLLEVKEQVVISNFKLDAIMEPQLPTWEEQ